MFFEICNTVERCHALRTAWKSHTKPVSTGSYLFLYTKYIKHASDVEKPAPKLSLSCFDISFHPTMGLFFTCSKECKIIRLDIYRLKWLVHFMLAVIVITDQKMGGGGVTFLSTVSPCSPVRSDKQLPLC